MFSRRALLAAFSAMVPAAALMGCTTSTDTNGNTTVTINVAEVDGYAKVGISAVATILSVAPVASVLGASTVASINAASAALTAALAAFDNACNGKLTFTLDDSSIVAAAKSIISDLSTLVDKLKASASSLTGKIGTNDLANVNTAINAATTALALSETLLGYVSANPGMRMTRPEMFKAVGLPIPVWVK